MKWGRQLRRGAILLIHTTEEMLNGQGYDTEEDDQEAASQVVEGKARR
jgi:hypothetical protein